MSGTPSGAHAAIAIAQELEAELEEKEALLKATTDSLRLLQAVVAQLVHRIENSVASGTVSHATVPI